MQHKSPSEIMHHRCAQIPNFQKRARRASCLAIFKVAETLSMTEHDERKWVIVGALFATLFLIWGPLNAGGVFFVPVITHFGWNRGFFSLLVGVGPLAAGLSSPAAGWLMDRIEARKLMIVGASMVAFGYVALSRANSALEFLLIFI